RQIREDAGVERGQQLGQQRVGEVIQELAAVGRRWLRVPDILGTDADEELVDQRASQARHLRPRPAPEVASVEPVAPEPYSLTTCGRPHSDDRGGVTWSLRGGTG